MTFAIYLLNIANGTFDCLDLVPNLKMRTDPLGFRPRPLLHAPFATTNYRHNSSFVRSSIDYKNTASHLNIDLFCTNPYALRRQPAN